MADAVTIPPAHQSQIAAGQTPFNSSGGLQPRAVHSPRSKSTEDELNVMAPNRSGFKVAFLGPAGTYSHQCAHDKFGSNFEYVGCTEISDIYNTTGLDVPFAVIPQENSIHGSVIDTYDLLRLPDMGRTKFVRGEATLHIKHCLVAHRGTKLEHITKVMSHEQALGQCRSFIVDAMPGVTVQRAPSTAAAAKALLLPENRTASAICSKLCVELFPGLEILLEGIEDRSPSGKLANNHTRFYVLATALDIPVPWTSPALTQRYGLLRMSIPRPDKPPPPSWTGPSVTDRIVAIALPMNRIDRRPSPDVDGNVDMYFVEVRDNQDDGATWAGRLEQAVERVKALGGDAVVLGFWEVY